MDLNPKNSPKKPNKPGEDKRKPNRWLALVVAIGAVLLIGTI